MRNLLGFALNYFQTDILKRRIKPRVLQMPITSRCNSRCQTCNIWKDKSINVNIDSVALRKALMDPFFSEVNSVGINGGEPSLYQGFEELLDALFVLKKLHRVYFISNAIISHRLLEMMETAKKKCGEKNIEVHLTISVDGYKEVHDNVRGIPNVFDKTFETLLMVKADQSKYCDVLDAGCTLSNDNVAYVIQTKTFLESKGIDAYYHPAVPNKRLHNFEGEHFSIMDNDRSRMLATEYFYGQFKYGNENLLKGRLRSFLTYYYLLRHGNCRLAGCNYLRSDVTITENLDLCLCATASNVVGNLKEYSANELLKKEKLFQEEIDVKQHCVSCVHYIIFPTIKGMFLYIKELLKPTVWIKYKILSLWLR